MRPSTAPRRLKPGDAAIAHNKGRALEALGRLDEAERAYDEALSIDHRLMPSLIGARQPAGGARRLDGRAGRSRHGADQPAQRSASAPAPRRIAAAPGRLAARPRPTTRRGWRSPPTATRPTCRAGRASRRRAGCWSIPSRPTSRAMPRMRDTLMLARGVDAIVQCAPTLANWLSMPTIDRGAVARRLCRRGSAAQPAASSRLDARCPAAAARPDATRRAVTARRLVQPRPIRRPASTSNAIPSELTRCRFVVGDDAWPAHLAARLGIPTIILLSAGADWLWGPRLGPSPWYPSAEVVAADDAEALASRVDTTTSP